jgi:hypothetical protein
MRLTQELEIAVRLTKGKWSDQAPFKAAERFHLILTYVAHFWSVWLI